MSQDNPYIMIRIIYFSIFSKYMRGGFSFVLFKKKIIRNLLRALTYITQLFHISVVKYGRVLISFVWPSFHINVIFCQYSQSPSLRSSPRFSYSLPFHKASLSAPATLIYQMRLFHGKVRKSEMEKASFFLHRERSIPAVPLRFLYSFFSSANDDCRLGARDSIKRFSGHVEITKCLSEYRVSWGMFEFCGAYWLVIYYFT